jgi:hypothetical protein
MTLLAALVALPAQSAAQGLPQATDDNIVYSVTIAARGCSEYTDIMANKARNNIMESLRDLGKDSVYNDGQPHAGQAVDPSIEEPNNPACHPLNNWQFTLGNGIDGTKVQNLSRVANPSTISAPTATVPLLDDQGQPTGTLEGATTVVLTADQVDASTHQGLWIQGGLFRDPLMFNTSANPGNTQGFGALRCAIDNLNGDNVEWIGFPSSTRHVFCYFYTVDPAPTAGTIIVRKQTTPGSNTHTFHFTGNISYNSDNSFVLEDVSPGNPKSITFVRGATDTDPDVDPSTQWSFTESDDTEFEPTGPPECSSANGDSDTDISGQTVTVTLAAEDTVTCTYTDQPRPTGPLALFKESANGVGTFGFDVTQPDGTTQHFDATTTRVDTPVQVATAPNGGPTGTWTATETLPPDNGGTWSLDRVECNGEEIPHNGLSASLDVTVGVAESCTFYNTFAPAGSITITKVTHGGVGTFGYVVRDLSAPEGDDATVGVQTATTTQVGASVTASGDPLTGLDIYSTPTDTTVPGHSTRLPNSARPKTRRAPGYSPR